MNLPRRSGSMALMAAAAAVLLCAACGRDLQRLKILIDKPASPPQGAIVTGTRNYRSLTQAYQDLDQAQADATVALYPAFTATLHAGAFARIAHVTDVQIREERGLLLGRTETDLIELASQSVLASLEGTRRDPLMEIDSSYVWLATVLTLNSLSQQFPIDLTLHTGDATDIGLKSEAQQFFHVANKLQTPFLDVIGNHDMLCLGLWNAKDAFAAVYINSVDVSAEFTTVYQANGDGLMQDRATYLNTVGAAVGRLGPHVPTRQTFGSESFGYDLSPDPLGGYYTVPLRAPAGGLPGLQLVVLRTSRDGGGADGEMDATQLAWLKDTLDAEQTRQSLVVVAAHHPVMDVQRNDSGLGAPKAVVVTAPLKDLHALLLRYPNVVAYLCGHTHLPEIVEVTDDSGALQFVQIDSGSLLAYPQEAAIVELLVDPGTSQVTVFAQKFGPMIAGGSSLAGRVVEALGSAARDDMSKPRYSDWRTYSNSRPLPSFPVAVP